MPVSSGIALSTPSPSSIMKFNLPLPPTSERVAPNKPPAGPLGAVPCATAGAAATTVRQLTRIAMALCQDVLHYWRR